MEHRSNLGKEYLYRSVMTASPTELLVILFDACIKNIRLAEMAMEGKPNYIKVSDCLIKAQRIINELISSLNMDIELSSSLLSIYEFLLHALREANVKKDLSQMPLIIEILTTQRDTWQQIAGHHQESSEVLCG